MKKQDLGYLLLLFGLTFSFFLFFGGDQFYIGDDTIFHTSNILAMASDISWSSPIPGRIFPELVNHLGYGVGIFYPSFPHVVGAYLYKIVSFFGGDIVFVMKFLFFVTIYLSGVSMYLYVRKVFSNRKQALFSAIIYMSMPYLFSDVFLRGAFNESNLFWIVPLIFLGIHYLLEEGEFFKFYLCFVLGYTLLIYTHLVLAIYFTGFLALYLVCSFKKFFQKKVLLALGSASVIVLLLTSPFWTLVLEHYLLDNYYIFSLSYVDSLAVEVIPFYYYFFPLPYFNYLLFYLSLICILFLFLAFIAMITKGVQESGKRVLVGMMVIFVGSFLLGSVSSIWDVVPNLFRNIQFGWRLSLFVSFSASVIAGVGLTLFTNKWKKVGIVVACLFLVWFAYGETYDFDYVTMKEEDYLKNSCCSLQWSYEYLPLDAKYNALYLANRGQEIVINDSKVEVVLNDASFPNMSFRLAHVEEKVKVEFPRIYYLGYRLVNEEGEEVSLYQNPFGLLQADIYSDGEYRLEYTGTIFSKVAIVLCVIAFVVWVGILGYCYKKDF